MDWKQLQRRLEELAPPALACAWDNSGLLLGRAEKEIQKVCIALDASQEAVQCAVRTHCDLLLTHHPLVFAPLRQISDDTVLGTKLLELAERRISLYAMHTNFDGAKGGMADLAAEALGLVDAEPLEEAEGFPGCGIGKVGNLKEEMTVADFLQLAKGAFGAETVGFYPGTVSFRQKISRIAVCPGSGADEISLSREKGAQMYVTGDLKYHTGMDCAEAGLPLLNIDHYSMEKMFVKKMAAWFAENLPDLEIVVFEGMNPCRFL